MRVFTLLLFVLPAHVLFAQKNNLVNDTHFKTYAEAMFGKPLESAPTAALTTSMSGKAEAKTATDAVERTPVVVEKDTLTPLPATPASLATKEPPVIEKTIVKRQVAVWNNTRSKENMSNCFALHKWLPVGSTVSLKNPMNGRVVTVKIVGRLPDNEQYANVNILISGGAARELHILDQKFIVNVIMPVSLVQR